MNLTTGFENDKGKNKEINEGNGDGSEGTTPKRANIAPVPNGTPATTPNAKAGPNTNSTPTKTGTSPLVKNPNHAPVTARAQWAAIKASRAPRGGKR